MIFPEPLKKGDKIAIVSPASSIRPEYVDGACRVITQMGFEPVVGMHCKGKFGGYSGTVEERLADFLTALNYDAVKAILCSRGGYGAVHLLEFLDGNEIFANAKWLIGFSDISALHAAMWEAGVVSVHASMAKHLAQFGAENDATKILFDVLQGVLPKYEVPSHPYNVLGEAEGYVMGGNMAVLSGLIDTDYDLLREVKGGILFIEDIGEPIYKVERMLYNLQLSDVLPRLKGLIVGRFTEYQSPDGNGETMEQMIRRMVAPYDFPVAFDFPVGHIDENVPMLEGAIAHLSVCDDKVTLEFYDD